MDKILEALQTLRVTKVIEEYDLQESIARALDEKGISYKKEYRLGKGNRVDFMTTAGVVIEAKKSKPNRTKAFEQVERYAAFKDVTGIILVVETSLRIPLPDNINGKRCVIVGLQKLWGIAL